jgi:hypothetical protein
METRRATGTSPILRHIDNNECLFQMRSRTVDQSTHLFFDYNFNSIVETMSGAFISFTPAPGNDSEGKDISLVQAAPINPPGLPEPPIWAMLMLGLAGIGLMHSRSRRRTAVA